MTKYDPVNHPQHYTQHPSGVECIQITEKMGFCLGNAVKYLFRYKDKGNPTQDLEKALWYIDRAMDSPRLTSPAVDCAEWICSLAEWYLYEKNEIAKAVLLIALADFSERRRADLEKAKQLIQSQL